VAVTSRYNLKLLYSRDEISAVVKRLAAKISDDYRGKDLIVIGVLKGAVIFLADLVREISIPVEIDFIGVSSYGNEMTSCGQVKVNAQPAAQVTGRHILIVEDIIDTGLCIEALIKHFSVIKPASIGICALLDKPARHQVPVEVSYKGFTIPDKFVVGYGLDYAQRYRHLPQIYTLEEVPDEGQLASDD
jgi:hypoxanthine phosphoribosyltransferase